MRTNIVLDDKLVHRAFMLSGAATKKQLIHLALSEYVNTRSRADLRQLKGKIRFQKDYNHKALRVTCGSR